MIKVLLFSSILLIASGLMANDACEEPVSASIAVLLDAAVPNCFNTESIEEEIDNAYHASDGNFSRPICGECRNNFHARLSGYPNAPTEVARRKRKDFIKMMYDELEKNLAQTLNSMTNLRSLPNMDNNFAVSMEKCSARNWGTRLKTNCGPLAQEVLAGKNLGGRLAQELAALLEPPPHEIAGILDRKESNTCQIPDNQIMHAVVETGIEMIDTNSLRRLASIELQESDEVFRVIQRLDLPEPIRQVLITHPIFSALLKNPAAFKSFFQSLNSSQPQEAITAALRSKLYAASNNELIDQSFATSCEQTYNNFFKAVCSVDEQDIQLGSLDNAYRLLSVDDIEEAPEFTSTPEQVETNLSLFSFCDSNGRDSLADNLPLDPEMSPRYIQGSLEEFSTEKYEWEFLKPGNSICEKINSDCSNSSTYQCLLTNKFKSLYRSPGAPIANESRPGPNSKVNDLLREMIGTNVQVPPEVRTVLVQNGILHDTPENEAKANKVAATPVAGANSTSSSPRSAAKRSTSPSESRSSNVPTSNPGFASGTPSTVAPTSSTGSSPSRESVDEDFDESQFQDELRRRMGSSTPSQSNTAAARPAPASAPAATAAERGRRTPRARTAGSNGADYTLPGPAAPIAPTLANPVTPTSTQLPDDQETPAEARAREQRTAAYAHLDRGNGAATGATAATGAGGRAPAADGRVVITAPEDRIRLNLEDVLNENFLQGPLSEQLQTYIQTKRDFFLEINNSVFQVTFDERTRAYSVRPKTGEPVTNLASRLETYLNRRVTRTHSLRELQTSLPE